VNDTLPSKTPDPVVSIRQALDDLAAFRAVWNGRRPLPETDRGARAAGDSAVRRIDTMLRQLVDLRGVLQAEIAIEDYRFLALDDQDRR
jgi:hypothetical protein